MSAGASSSRGALAVLAPAALCLALGWQLGVHAGPDDAAAPSYLELLTRDLALTPAQVAAISELLSAQDRDIQDLVEAQRLSLREPVAARLQRTEDEMLELLEDHQRQIYQRLVAGR